jgi:hypothetical protein
MSTITDLTKASFCEGVEKGHSSHSSQAAIAKTLGITNPSVQMDSQAKYASIARGVGEIYLRLPVTLAYEERIWVCVPSPPTLMPLASGLLIVGNIGSCSRVIDRRRSWWSGN